MSRIFFKKKATEGLEEKKFWRAQRTQANQLRGRVSNYAQHPRDSVRGNGWERSQITFQG